MNHNTQKKIAVINDIAGFGRCSISVQLPIISAMKVQCCPLITSIFSNHTAYESYFMDDYTEKMEPYFKEWKKLNLEFNGICTGYLGSKEQIAIVEKFIREFKHENTKVIIDPVMGDEGKFYSDHGAEIGRELKRLLPYANLLTPNITEACILTETPYKDDFTNSEIKEIAEKLSEKGPEKIVITGVVKDKFISNFCYDTNQNFTELKAETAGQTRCGTGDIFTAILAADMVNGNELEKSVEKASAFIRKCITGSEKMKIPLTDGVCFEEYLKDLLEN